MGDVGEAKDASQLQYNIVRIDGQKSAYIPIMKQGGDTNTLQVVNDVRNLTAHLFDLPRQLKTSIVFDQSVFVKEALKTVLHEGVIGLVLTSLMILIFLGSMRATVAVLLSIPISALATFVILYMLGSTVNTMILGGLALAFSRVIDNSVISLENIYRHLEMGSSPAVAADEGGAEVNLAVLAATLVDVVDFFPVTLLVGVSKFLFSSLALAFCLSLLASFVVAMTVIPLFCSKFLKGFHHEHGSEAAEDRSLGGRFNAWFNRMFNRLLDFYERWVRRALKRPAFTLVLLMSIFLASLAIYPFLGRAFFPQTDAGQFTLNIKVPTGSRIEVTNLYVAKIENLIRSVVPPKDLKMIVSNIGVVNDFSSLYTTNAGEYTGTIQVALNDDHSISSLVYMDRVKNAADGEIPGRSRVLPKRLHGGCDSQFGHARADRRSGEHPRPGSDLQRGSGSGAPHSNPPGCGTDLYPARHELPRDSAERRPRARGRARAFAEGYCRQRHHRAQFEHHDRTQLLGGL